MVALRNATDPVAAVLSAFFNCCPFSIAGSLLVILEICLCFTAIMEAFFFFALKDGNCCESCSEQSPYTASVVVEKETQELPCYIN